MKRKNLTTGLEKIRQLSAIIFKALKEVINMEKVIMVGCDAHSENLLLMCALGREAAEKAEFSNTKPGRKALIANLKSRAAREGATRIVMAYEASSLGFGLYDELKDAGIECHVLAPTKMESSPQQRRTKTDERDAKKILEIVRGHVLAGNELPSVWIPDPETRDDREVVRARLDVADKLSAVKIQIQSLLKRNSFRRPEELKSSWTQKHGAWLEGLTRDDGPLGFGTKEALKTLLRQRAALEEEVEQLDAALGALAETVRYAEPVRALLKEYGVGLMTALVFLAELGDLSRFSNRREIGAYLGVVPSSYESGENSDKKGHITRQGPGRIRKVLCQSAWAIIRGGDVHERSAYARVAKRNPKHKKIGVVALMRRLGIRMWHVGLAAQKNSGCFKTADLDCTITAKVAA